VTEVTGVSEAELYAMTETLAMHRPSSII